MAKFRYKARLIREFTMELEAEDEYDALGWGENLVEGASVNAPCTQPDGKEVPWWWEFVSLEKLDDEPFVRDKTVKEEEKHE